MMENTRLNKRAFMAHYWGQKVYFQTEQPQCLPIEVNALTLMELNNCLLLKPLSSITDEELKELAIIAINPKEKPLNVIEIVRWDWVVRTLINRQPHNQDESVTIEMYVDVNLEYNEVSFTWEHIHLKGSGRQERHLPNAYRVYQFLISRGYYVGQGEEIEYGWVKIKNNET